MKVSLDPTIRANLRGFWSKIQHLVGIERAGDGELDG